MSLPEDLNPATPEPRDTAFVVNRILQYLRELPTGPDPLLEARVTQNEADIADLTNRMNTAETNININTSAISALDGRVTTNENNIASNDSDIANLQGRMNTAEAELNEDRLTGTFTCGSGSYTITVTHGNIQSSGEIIPIPQNSNTLSQFRNGYWIRNMANGSGICEFATQGTGSEQYRFLIVKENAN